ACLLALTGKFRFRKTQLAHDEQTREGVTDEVYRCAGELFRASLMTSSLAFADTVTVVTSFPRDLTDPFKAAFEAAHPGTVLEVVNRNTNAAVSHLKETRSANAVDLMWASAPDAFEVLKADGLLAKVDVNSEGIPDEIGGYPINDPDGTYYGFAASGYGIMYNTRYIKANDLPIAKEW